MVTIHTTILKKASLMLLAFAAIIFAASLSVDTKGALGHEREDGTTYGHSDQWCQQQNGGDRGWEVVAREGFHQSHGCHYSITRTYPAQGEAESNVCYQIRLGNWDDVTPRDGPATGWDGGVNPTAPGYNPDWVALMRSAARASWYAFWDCAS